MAKINLLFKYLLNIFVRDSRFCTIFGQSVYYVDKECFIKPDTVRYSIVYSQEKIYKVIENLNCSEVKKTRHHLLYRSLVIGFKGDKVKEIYATKESVITYGVKLKRIK